MSLGTMEQRTEGMKRQAQELIEQAYQRGYKVGKDEAYKSPLLTKDAYMQGLNDAWEAAGKLVSMDHKKCNEVLGDDLTIDTVDEIFARCTAFEAIDKLRAYESRKQKEESEIHVGDVIRNYDVEAVVTWCNGKDWNGFLLKGEGVGEVGQVYSCMSCNEWKKTGRHFPEIVEVLKKLKGGE